MSSGRRLRKRLRAANPVPPGRHDGRERLPESSWGVALHAAVVADAAPVDDSAHGGAARPVRGRRRLALTLGLAALVATGGSVLAITGLPGAAYHEPAEPRAELSTPADRPAAASGDARAAERILRAGGWSPREGTLRPLIARELAGERHILWAYEGLNGPAVFLLMERDPLGGVHSDCAPGEMGSCGAAYSSDGHGGRLVTVGSTDLRAVRSEARFADGSAVEAPTADGYWFVRLAFTAASPMPTIVVSYDAGGRQVGRIDADDLRRSIAGGLAGPPNLAG